MTDWYPLYLGHVADFQYTPGRCTRCGQPATRNAHRIDEPGPTVEHPNGETYRLGRLEVWQTVCDACFVVGRDDAPEHPCVTFA